MKKYISETFTQQLDRMRTTNLHIEKESNVDLLPEQLEQIPSLIMYGPSGVGKYTQMLNIVSKYSPSQLKYEKKVQIIHPTSKEVIMTVRMSDIHYEVDMQLLGCNAKTQWHIIYNQLRDIIASQNRNIFDKDSKLRKGFIVCRNFQHIHSELLDCFYTYMFSDVGFCIRFIILTDSISFIPDCIVESCMLNTYARPSRMKYAEVIGGETGKLSKTIYSKLKENMIHNINNEFMSIPQLSPCEKVCEPIIEMIIHKKTLDYSKLREMIYDILVHHINVQDAMYHILQQLYKQHILRNNQLQTVTNITYEFLKLYNNNYRPIFHLEKYLLQLVVVVHGIK
jgi:hypothetical protein|uniref:Replication factor C C-terminal domain-containing protein n=1 Tax=viral metagenome TaxID=1070528 RepID=A0A6C0JCB4_9ZZZZ